MKNVGGIRFVQAFHWQSRNSGRGCRAVFKLKPIPESETFVQADSNSLDEVDSLLAAVLDSDLTPMVFDLHNVTTPHAPRTAAATLVLGFAGAREDVEFQLHKASELGIHSPSSLDYQEQYWNGAAAEPVRRTSVLPSELIHCIRRFENVPFVARAGNGEIWHRGGPAQAKANLPCALLGRVKDTFDPKHILPE